MIDLAGLGLPWCRAFWVLPGRTFRYTGVEPSRSKEMIDSTHRFSIAPMIDWTI
jgi:hypothetical protein